MSQLHQDSPPYRHTARHQRTAPPRGRVRFSSVVAALGIAAALCAGCGSGTSGSAVGTPSAAGTATATSSASASAALCADLQALNDNVNQLKSLDPNSVTPDQLRSILERANTNLQNAAQNASGIAATKLDAIKAAYSALVSALGSLPTTDTATQAYQSVEPQVVALVSALGSAATETGCPSASASSSSSSSVPAAPSSSQGSQ